MELKSASNHNIPAFLVRELSRFWKADRPRKILWKFCEFWEGLAGSDFSKVIIFCFFEKKVGVIISFWKDFLEVMYLHGTCWWPLLNYWSERGFFWRVETSKCASHMLAPRHNEISYPHRQGSAESIFTLASNFELSPQFRPAHLRNWSRRFDGQFRWGEKTGEWSMRQDLIVAQLGVAVLRTFFSDVTNDPLTNLIKVNKSDGVAVADVFACLEKKESLHC